MTSALWLAACAGPDGPKIIITPEPHTGTGTQATGDTGQTAPCLPQEVLDNGVDDDCNGWANEFGEGGVSLTGAAVALQGEAWDSLGISLAANEAADGTVWLAAGGAGDVLWRIYAAPQPGGPLMRITAANIYHPFGSALAVGTFDDGPVSIVVSDMASSFVGVYRGREGELAQTNADAILPDSDELFEFSSALRAADLDGDGLDELLVSAPGGLFSEESPASDLLIFTSPVTPSWDNVRAHLRSPGVPPKSPQNFAYWLGEIADLTGDGLPEIPVYSEEEGGAVWLIPGDITGDVLLLDVAIARLSGEEPNDDAGSRTAAGDADGDGYIDLLVGAPLADSRNGVAYLVSGPITADGALADGAARFVAEYGYEWCGHALAFLPDSDADGADDPVVACPQDAFAAPYRPGRVSVYRGPDASGTLGLAEAALSLVGAHPRDFAGYQVLAKHDLTGDGVPDLAVSAPGDESFASPDAGVVYVLPGPLL